MQKILLTIFFCLPGWIVFGWNSCVFAQDIVLGMSSDFSGPNRALGIEFYRGAGCFFNNLNQSGGLNGREIIIKAYDDGYEPDPAVNNTISLVEQDEVFALFNYVGTPTTTRILPLLKHYRDSSVYLFTPLTGAKPVYDSDYVFSLRASYDDETEFMVDKLMDAGFSRIAVLHQLDAYGRGGWQGVQKALNKHGLSIVAEATYERGASLTTSFNNQVGIIKQHEPDAVISIAAYEPAAAFVRDARDNGLNAPVLNLSFVNSRKMLELLTLLERTAQKDYTSGLINSQVVPFYGYEHLELAREYIACIESDMPEPPVKEALHLHQFMEPTSVGFEGYLNAMFMLRILENMGTDISRHRIKEIAAKLTSPDVGLHYNDLFFQQEGFPRVNFVSFKDQRITSITDFSELKN